MSTKSKVTKLVLAAASATMLGGVFPAAQAAQDRAGAPSGGAVDCNSTLVHLALQSSDGDGFSRFYAECVSGLLQPTFAAQAADLGAKAGHTVSTGTQEQSGD